MYLRLNIQIIRPFDQFCWSKGRNQFSYRPIFVRFGIVYKKTDAPMANGRGRIYTVLVIESVCQVFFPT